MNKEKITDECMTEMFARVGLTYPCDSLTKRDDWFMQKVWTLEEEDDFRRWMVKKLKRHKMPKPELETAMFLLMWGWRVDYKEVA